LHGDLFQRRMIKEPHKKMLPPLDKIVH
jgi:hypothetical protein